MRNRFVGLLIMLLVGMAPCARAGAVDAKGEAQRHFNKAGIHYKAGRWTDAIAEYQQAYDQWASPSFLLNIALSYENEGDAVRAIEYYRKYLAADPNGKRVAEARTHLAVLEAKLPKPAPVEPPEITPVPVGPGKPSPGPIIVKPVEPPPPPNDPPVVATSRSKAWMTMPILVGIGAAAGFAAGGGLYAWAKSDNQNFRMTCAPNCAEDAVNGAKGREVGAFVLMGVGGALLIGDFVLWAMLGRRKESGRTVRVVPTAGGLVVGGAF